MAQQTKKKKVKEFDDDINILNEKMKSIEVLVGNLIAKILNLEKATTETPENSENSESSGKET